MKKGIIFMIIALLVNGAMFAKDNSGPKNDPMHLKLMLPIEVVANGQRKNLVVVIPEHFQPIGSLKDLANSPMQEFIPVGTVDPYKWSEIITTQAFVGVNLPAKVVVQRIIYQMRTTKKGCRVINESHVSNNGYDESTMIVSYYSNGRHEICFARYYSGRLDCSGVQYSVVISGEMTETKALEKINAFVGNAVSVCDF